MNGPWGYQTIPDDNTSLNGLDTGEDSMMPSAANNSFRELMADVKKVLNDTGGKLVSGGSANAQTLTTESVLTAYFDGLKLSFIAGFTITDAATLNVNTIGAKSLRGWGDVALVGGEIVAGSLVTVAYDESANSAAGAWMVLAVASSLPSADVASAGTVNLGAVASDYVRITGNTGPITSFGTCRAGVRKLVRFASTPTITYNATSMILPSAANITAAAGDMMMVVSEGSGNWRVAWYQRADGTALVAAAAPTMASLTDGDSWTAEVTVASAGTCDILGAASDFIEISGTTTITSLGTGTNKIKFVRFSGALTLTHNATSLILPTGANITTEAGDTCIVISDGSSNARIRGYQRANGQALAVAITQAGWTLLDDQQATSDVTSYDSVTGLSAYSMIMVIFSLTNLSGAAPVTYSMQARTNGGTYRTIFSNNDITGDNSSAMHGWMTIDKFNAAVDKLVFGGMRSSTQMLDDSAASNVVNSGSSGGHSMGMIARPEVWDQVRILSDQANSIAGATADQRGHFRVYGQ